MLCANPPFLTGERGGLLIYTSLCFLYRVSIFFCQGVCLVIDIHEVRYVQVRIFLGCRKRCMAEEFLNHPEVRTALKQMACKRMPERMRPDTAVDPDSSRILYNDTPYPPFCQSFPHSIQEQSSFLAFEQHPLYDVRFHRIDCF